MKRWIRKFRWILPLLIIVIFTADAYGRIGGGRSRSRSHSSYRSRSSSSNSESFWLVYLAIKYPAVGIPLLIVILIAGYKGTKKGALTYQDRTISNYKNSSSQYAYTNALKNIQARDEQFNEARFCHRVRGVFSRLQYAWSNGDLSTIRPFVSDAVYTRFELLYDTYRHSRIKPHMENLRIIDVKIVAIESNKFYDTVHVAINASACDSFIDIETGKRVGAKAYEDSFTEVWSFVRKPNAKTLNQDGLLEGFCPNCGTPLQINESAQCESCKALVTSGAYDWVLTEITQNEDWSAPKRNIPKLAQLEENDPAFSLQSLEDRASTAFWQYLRALYFGKEGELQAFVTPNFFENNSFAKNPDGTRRFYADPAVSSVDTIFIQLAKESDGFDRIFLKVAWSAHLEECELEKRMIPNYNASTQLIHTLVMKRRHDAKSDEKTSLNSQHCRGCGNPVKPNDRGVCSYCGSVFVSDDVWLLDSISYGVDQRVFEAIQSIEIEQNKTVQPEPEIFLPQDQELIVHSLISVMLADGEIDEKERKTLNKFVKRFDINEAHLTSIIKSHKQNGAAVQIDFSQPRMRMAYLETVIEMALSDVRIDAYEMKMLEEITKSIGLQKIDLTMTVNRIRGQLYQEAKAAKKS